MNAKILGLLTVGLMAGPVVANAQVITLDYQGNVMSGSIGMLYNDGVVVNTPLADTITASITLGGSLAAQDLTLVSLNVSLDGGLVLSGSELGQSPFGGWPLGGISGEGAGSLNLTTLNGQITGAVIDVTGDWNSATSNHQQLSIGNGSGDSYFNSGDTGGDGVSSPYGFIESESGTPGVWTVAQAPEIDPASAASGLTLLLGSLLVMRARRITPSSVTTVG